MALQPDALRRTALVLVIAGLVWNLVEAGVALWAGVQAGSVALLAFNLDSIVELFAGGVLVARLRQEREGVEDEAAERRAQRLLGISFFLLAAYIALHSGASILGWLPEPQPSLAGVGIVVASAVVMGGLYVGKMRVAARMHPVRRNAAAEHRQIQGAQREHPPPGHGPLRGEPVVQVSVGGEQQYCKGYVRPIRHLVDVERVQPGKRGNRQDEPASPDIDPGHAAQLARLRQIEAAKEGWKRAGRCAHWVQGPSPSPWITAHGGWNATCPSTRRGVLSLEMRGSK